MSANEQIDNLIYQFKIARLKSGKSGDQVYFDTGITQPTISKFEKGERMCKLDTLAILADYFGYELKLEAKCES